MGAHLAILLPARPLHLGSFRATPYGLCAAAGLVVGMAATRRTAVRSGLDPDAAWDAGIFAIFCCFLASRLLLISRDPRVFLRYPLLFLALPSLTLGGMAIAAALTWLYMRYKRLPVHRTLDVYAAPFALLGTFSELGHWLDRSEPGMPTHVPWAVRDTLGGAASRVHPVALYGVSAGLLLALVLWRALPRKPAGQVAALGLAAGGILAFLLDMVSQPNTDFHRDPWLEPGQWIALAAVAAGGVLWMTGRHVYGAANDVDGGEPGASAAKSERLDTETH